MAVIDQYTSNVLAQGQVNSQASAQDFGAGVGEAVGNLGRGVQQMQDKLYENEVADEVTRAHQVYAQKQLEWTQAIQDRGNNATPGDRDFATGIINDVTADMEKAGGQFKTRKAQQLFANLSSRITESFGAQAIGYQGKLDGIDATNRFAQTTEAYNKLANGNADLYDFAMSDIGSMLDDPNGQFSKLPRPVRDELKQKAKYQIAQSAVEGAMSRDIYGVASKLLPDSIKELYTAPQASAAGSVPDWTATGGSPKTEQGMIEPGNIDLTSRPRVKNRDGSISTVRSLGVNIDDQEVLIPTVVNGKVVSDKQAIDHYLKTGEHLGKFSSPEASSAYAEKLHNQQAAGLTQDSQPDFSNLDPKQAKRLAAVKLSPAHVAAIDAASGGDTKKAAFLRTVVTIENRGKAAPDDNAVSPVGAAGAFQFMPATGAQYGLSGADRNDFAKSAKAASKFYDDLNKMYGGNQAAMLAYYNGGKAAGDAVARGGQPPSAETRDYLKMGLALGIGGASTTSPAPAETTTPTPQLKVPKDVVLAPPQGVDIPGWNDMSLDQQQRMMQKLVTDFNARIGVDRATLQDDRANALANLRAGNDYAGLAELRSRYPRAFGPEMASRMVAEEENARSLGLFTKSIKGRSPQEIETSLGLPPGSNSTANDYETYKQKLLVVQQDRKELADNPVGYVARYSTPVKQAALLAQNARADAEKRGTPDAIQGAADATQKFITASIAEQRRLGVADPKIISEDEEKVLQQKIEQIAGSGRDVAQSLDGLYKSYGSYGPQVAAQMSKKIGGMMNVIGAGIDPNAATLLVEANRNKADLEKTLPPEKTKDLDVAVRNAMRDFSQSLAGGPNNANVQGTYQEQISLLAMTRMSKFGESQNEAVQKAYQQLVGDQYNFQDGYRVPKAVDAKAVRNQAQYLLNAMGPQDVALLPGSVGNPEDRMQAQLSSIRAHGRWVTSSQPTADGKSEEGLMLVVPTPGGVAPIPGANGKPVFRSFGQMVIDYQSRGVVTSQDALLRGDMKAYDKLRTQERAEQRKREDQRAADMGRAFRAGQ